MADDGVRVLSAAEQDDAARVALDAMLGSISPERLEFWRERVPPGRTHGSFAHGSVVGTARWFPTAMSTPGGGVEAGAVTGVAVLPTHRRQGHLTGLMDAQLAQIAEEGVPVAILIAAEWGIYGRFGYGPAIEACGWRLDTSTARFTDPPAGTVELLHDVPEIRDEVRGLHDGLQTVRPGVITRDDLAWDLYVGLQQAPGHDAPDPGMVRAARWRDAGDAVRGAVRYKVTEHWEANRPRGTAHVLALYGADPVAERELWRHLCSLDWVSTVTTGGRPVDDLLPLWLADGRAAVQVDRFDHIWARLLDVPAAMAARSAGATADVVVEVLDPLGHAAGRWRLGGDRDEPIDASPTDAAADLTLSVGVLSACYLGGHRPPTAWFAIGAIDEHSPGSVRRLDALLASPVAPWCPTSF